MRPIKYRFPVPTNSANESVGTAAPARPSRAKLGSSLPSQPPPLYKGVRFVALVALMLLPSALKSETRPHYSGTVRIQMQSSPETLDLSLNPTPAEYWDITRTLSLIGETLVNLDAQSRPQPALAMSWQSDASARHWDFTLRRGVKFHDSSPASPAAIAQVLGALHPTWSVRASTDSISIDCSVATPSLLAELALSRNLILQHNVNGLPIGTGPFLVAEWQRGKLLRLAANENSWQGRPFVDAIQIEFGKSLRDQTVALQLEKADVIEASPQASNGPQRRNASASSLPVELLALVFSANGKAQDPRLREALALAIDRKPIQSVLLKGAGEPASTILPNWMTGYTAVFTIEPDAQRARALLANSRQPMLNLSYDPRDPQAQLIAERIALNAREVGITVQVSLSGAEDLRLTRIVLPSPDLSTSLAEAARQFGFPEPAISTHSLEDLYRAERALLDGYAVIPLFHLPLATDSGPRVRNWEPDRLGDWNGPGHSLADVWLADPAPAAASR
jgi:ABC-type transport system substrate-binding protein